jgi:hypothetical protein
MCTSEVPVYSSEWLRLARQSRSLVPGSTADAAPAAEELRISPPPMT